VFEIDESKLERDIVGEPILPRWVHPADDQRGAAKRIDREKSHALRAAVAAGASGPVVGENIMLPAGTKGGRK